MPKNKDLKRLARARMDKTGESYTTARSQLLRKKVPVNLAEIAGMSDEAVRARTGREWKEWVRILDAKGAASMSHRDIARYAYEELGIPGWWAQMITVGYERIRGLREKGQRRGGTYEIGKSRTFPVPVGTLYRSFSVARTRREWLPDVALAVRKATPSKSMRLTWPDGTSVEAYFLSKGPRKSQVAIQHRGIASKADSSRRKEYWAERLSALEALLSTSASASRRRSS
jgi:hypothetical protein